MERASEKGKKYPLVVLGEVPLALAGTPSISLLDLNQPEKFPINDNYVFVALSGQDVPEAIALLEKAKVSPDQVVVYFPQEYHFQHGRLAFLGRIEPIEGESAEEFRGRLSGKLEGQRQKKLVFALHEASELSLARRLNETDLQKTLDATRVAHALACSFALSPASHTRLLQACLESPTMLTGQLPWPSDISLERLIFEAAGFIVDCSTRGVGFRDAVREKAAGLPFKARTELLHHVENCFGLLLGGKSNAA